MSSNLGVDKGLGGEGAINIIISYGDLTIYWGKKHVGSLF